MRPGDRVADKLPGIAQGPNVAPGGSPAAYARRTALGAQHSTLLKSHGATSYETRRSARDAARHGPRGGARRIRQCAADGSSASYSETISTAQGVVKRTIVTNGCPNHESYCTGKPGPAPTCKDKGEQGSDTEAVEQDVSVDIPANPILKSSYTPGELDCSMGAIAYLSLIHI